MSENHFSTLSQDQIRNMIKQSLDVLYTSTNIIQKCRNCIYNCKQHKNDKRDIITAFECEFFYTIKNAEVFLLLKTTNTTDTIE